MGLHDRSDEHPDVQVAEPTRAVAAFRSRPVHPAVTVPAGRPVLYISGIPQSRVLFTRIARRWRPVKLLVAEGGEAGLRLVEERQLRLIAIDAVLPDTDAVDLVIRLRRARKAAAVPILVLGPDPSPQARARFMWVGANAVVTMPFDVAEVERTVQHLLHSVPLA
jgi:CheY-like chemotaxis protein